MLSPVTISVQKLFKSSALHTREQAESLFHAINHRLHPNEEMWVDFSNIDFISRSFADELVRLDLRSKKKAVIHFCCTSPNVQAMLEVVAHTQTSNSKEERLPVQRFDSLENLINYFSTI